MYILLYPRQTVKEPGLRAVTWKQWHQDVNSYLSDCRNPTFSYLHCLFGSIISPLPLKDAKWPNWQSHSGVLPQSTLANLWSSGHVFLELIPLSPLAPKKIWTFLFSIHFIPPFPVNLYLFRWLQRCFHTLSTLPIGNTENFLLSWSPTHMVTRKERVPSILSAEKAKAIKEKEMAFA